MNQSVYDRLISIAGDQNVSVDLNSLKSHSRDPGPFPPIIPGIVVTPTSSEMISEIVLLCNETSTPITPFGAAYSFTGLSNRKGSSTIVMDMKKMSKVINVDESNFTVRAESGIIVGVLSDQVKQRGYYVNTVAVPYYKDTLGGMLSGVIGGGHPLYSSSTGLNNKDIFSLKVVLPSGAIVETNKDPFMRETSSPDVTGLFVGDGGLFGVKTEAVLKMHEIPPYWKAGGNLFANFDDAYNAIREASNLAEEKLCDYLTLLSPEITEIYNANDSSRSFGVIYYLQGFGENAVDARARNVESIVEKHGARQGSDALSEFAEGMRTGEVYWKVNEYTETMIRRTSCAFFSSTSSFKNIFLKLYSFLQNRIQSSENSEKLGFSPAYVIHSVGRNCLWANIILNYPSYEAEPRAFEIMRDVHRLATQLGASFETHGGYAADLMGAAWSSEFRKMMIGIKKALDPNNVLNPELWFTSV